jgi:hypothetical protein
MLGGGSSSHHHIRKNVVKASQSKTSSLENGNNIDKHSFNGISEMRAVDDDGSENKDKIEDGQHVKFQSLGKKQGRDFVTNLKVR